MLKFESTEQAALNALRNVPREAAPVRVLVPMHAIQADEVLPAALRARDGWPRRAERSRSWSVRSLFAVDATVTREEAAAPAPAAPRRVPSRAESAPQAPRSFASRGTRDVRDVRDGRGERRAAPSGSVFTRVRWQVLHLLASLAGPEHAAVTLRHRRVRERQASRAV